MTVEQQITPTVIVGEQIAGQAAAYRKKLENIIVVNNKAKFEIGRLAYTIKSNGYYDGFTTFSEYAKTLPIKLRTIQYLTDIAEVEEKLNIPHEKTESLGIAKMREISSLDLEKTWVNPETGAETPIIQFVTAFVDKGEEMSLDEIQVHVRTLKGLVGDQDIEVKHYAWTRATIDNVINPAIEKAKAHIGSVAKDDEGVSKDASDSAAIEVWAIEYLNGPDANL